ncbi:hypothetical protein MAHJHV35_47830 [Mycobacterium avium subsp. hominissuis]
MSSRIARADAKVMPLATGAAAGAALVLTINWATGSQLHVPAVSLAGAAQIGEPWVTASTPAARAAC